MKQVRVLEAGLSLEDRVEPHHVGDIVSLTDEQYARLPTDAFGVAVVDVSTGGSLEQAFWSPSQAVVNSGTPAVTPPAGNPYVPTGSVPSWAQTVAGNIRIAEAGTYLIVLHMTSSATAAADVNCHIPLNNVASGAFGVDGEIVFPASSCIVSAVIIILQSDVDQHWSDFDLEVGLASGGTTENVGVNIDVQITKLA